MKRLLNSKTFWVAIAQAFVAVVIVALTELDMVGSALMVKSVADIWLRLLTNTEITEV